MASIPSGHHHRAFVALGSNVGNRVSMIEGALKDMQRRGIEVKRTSSLWETDAMYVVNQDKFLNGVCEVETEYHPEALLDQLKDIESSMGRQKTIDKGPRNIDLDIILYDRAIINTPDLVIPHPSMLEREFVLRPLCELIPSERLPSMQRSLRDHLHALSTAERPMSTVTPISRDNRFIRPLVHDRRTQIMGILNVSPDSFSDGGNHIDRSLDALAAQASRLEISGASILDIGGQSTRPGAQIVEEAEEVNRIVPLIRHIRDSRHLGKLCISVDTFRSSVARRAIDAGADIINDVSGGTMDPEMLPTVARLGCTICIMHMRGTPATMTKLANYPQGIIRTVGEELRSRVLAAEEAGIRRWRIIVDPGIGFAKTQSQNLELLRRLPLLRDTECLRGLPWLVGSSRKGFIGKITQVQQPRDRTWGTAATVAAAIAGGADVVRVHDVGEMSQVARMADAIWRVYDDQSRTITEFNIAA